MSYFHRSVISNLGNLLTLRQLFLAMFRPFSIQIDLNQIELRIGETSPKQLSSGKQIT